MSVMLMYTVMNNSDHDELLSLSIQYFVMTIAYASRISNLAACHAEQSSLLITKSMKAAIINTTTK